MRTNHYEDLTALSKIHHLVLCTLQIVDPWGKQDYIVRKVMDYGVRQSGIVPTELTNYPNHSFVGSLFMITGGSTAQMLKPISLGRYSHVYAAMYMLVVMCMDVCMAL